MLMDKHNSLAFKVGQLVEAKSFQVGYRGAWFRCKIKEISLRKGHIWHALEYFDFPDEKIRWTKLYQLPPINGKKPKCVKRQLMVRPSYPPLLHESQLPQGSPISEAVFVFNGVRQVGDLVDWWMDGCFWSGIVTEVLVEDKVQIELLQPPLGEGSSYEVSCKDLRPSLHWSPEDGWTVPAPLEGAECHPCVRLIQSPAQAEGPTYLEIHTKDAEDFPAAVIPNSSASSLAVPQKSEDSSPAEILAQPWSITVPKVSKITIETDMGFNLEENGTAKTSFLDGVPSTRVGDASAEAAKEKSENSGGCSKKLKTSAEPSLWPVGSCTLEASILDLEELANKVKWLKGVLEFGIPLPNSVEPQWKFVEHRPSSTQK